jgi:hypothetical protein
MTLSSIYYLLRGFESRPFGKFKLQTSSTMNNFNFSDCRKAVNQATFRPTAARKTEALKLLMDAFDFINNLEEVADKPSKKATKRRRKTTKKATPTQRVADRQEKAFHGKADSPVKPSKKAKTASVKEAAKSAKAVSEATGAAQRAAKKAEAKAKALKEEAKAQPKVDTKVDDKIASLEAKIEALTQCLAVAMESMIPASSSNEVGFDDVPFQL